MHSGRVCQPWRRGIHHSEHKGIEQLESVEFLKKFSSFLFSRFVTFFSSLEICICMSTKEKKSVFFCFVDKYFERENYYEHDFAEKKVREKVWEIGNFGRENRRLRSLSEGIFYVPRSP